MYLRFAVPIETTKPARAAQGEWVGTVKQPTQQALEQSLADLIDIRCGDQCRSLSPLAWQRAVQPT